MNKFPLSLPRRRDLIVGVIVSSSVIFGGAWFSQLTKGGKPASPVKAEPPTIRIVLPPLEPDQQDLEENAPQKALDVAPPILNDPIELAPPDSMVQPIEPPRPEDVRIDATAITIPEGYHYRSGGGAIFDPSQLDQQPVPTVQPRPTYPFEMRQTGTPGQVIVDFIVDTSGRVHNAFAASSSQRAFESAAVQAVAKWQFRAGRKAGRAVNTHMQVPILFTLNANE
jgi:protein TonB